MTVFRRRNGSADLSDCSDAALSGVKVGLDAVDDAIRPWARLAKYGVAIFAALALIFSIAINYWWYPHSTDIHDLQKQSASNGAQITTVDGKVSELGATVIRLDTNQKNVIEAVKAIQAAVTEQGVTLGRIEGKLAPYGPRSGYAAPTMAAKPTSPPGERE